MVAERFSNHSSIGRNRVVELPSWCGVPPTAQPYCDPRAREDVPTHPERIFFMSPVSP